jgi:hypothetical protein
MRRLGWAAPLLAVCGLVAGCTGNGAVATSSSAPVQASQAAAPSLPACAKAGQAVPIPADFPATFALPNGSLVVGADTPAGGGSRITALVPLEVDEFGKYLETALPAAGLAIGGGEAEADELESKFSGAGIAGQLTARELSDCAGILSVQVTVRAS